MKEIKEVLLMILGVVVIIVIIIGVWLVFRRINYELSYSDLVTETINQTVKVDCLKH